MRKRILIAIIALVLLLPVVAVTALLYTETGLALVAGQLHRLERLGIHIEGVSGTIAGPLRVARFEMSIPRLKVVSHDIVIDLELRGLLLQTIQTSLLSAHDTVVTLRDVQTPPSDKPPRFLPRFLRIDAQGADLTQVRYVHSNGTAVDAQRVQGRVTISSRRLRARDFKVKATQFDAAGNLRLVAGQPFGLDAQVNGRLRMERGTELVLAAQAGGTFDRLAMRATLEQPEAVAVDALLTRPNGRWKIAGHVVAASFHLEPFMEKPPFSLRNVRLDVLADPDGIRAAGNVGFPEFVPRDLTIDVRGRYASRVLHLADASIAINETPSTVRASGSIAFDGEAPTLDLAARWEALQWPLNEQAVVSSATGDVTLRGPLPYDFAVNAQVDGPSIPTVSGSAIGSLSKDQVVVSQYNFAALEGLLTGDATLQLAEPRAWKLTTHAINVNPAELHQQFPGNLTLTAAANGTALNRNARFDLNLSDLRGTLRDQPVRARGSLQRDTKGWRARGISAAFADARLTLDGSLHDTVDARWSLRAPSLSRLLPDAAGALESSGTVSGRLKTPHIVADAHATNLRYAGWSTRELDIDADVDAAGSSPSRLSLQAQELGRGQPLLEKLQIRGDGLASDHRIVIDTTGIAGPNRKSAPRLQLQVAGSYVHEVWNATVSTTELDTGDPRRVVSIPEPAKIVASTKQASLDNLCLVVGNGRVCAEGKWQSNGPWQGTVAGYEIPLTIVLPPSGEAAEYAGRIEGRVHVSGAPGQPLLGEAGMRIIDAAIIYRPQGAEPETLNLGTGGLAAKATPERIDFSFGVQAFADTFLYANAHLQRNGGNDIMKMPLTGDMRARAADANILPLVFPEVDHAAGLLTAQANITGTLARPEINGRIELERGELDSYRVNLALREANAVADLARNGLDFRGTARAGDGRAEVEGKFTWEGGESSGDLHLHGESLLVADLPEYRVVASPDLRFQIRGKSMQVAGNVAIPSARIQPVQLTGAVRASPDARYVDEHPAEKAGRFVVQSEIRITMGDDVRIEAFGLQGQIVGGVTTISRTGDTPIGRGELEVNLGRYEAYGQKLEINRGRLLFDNSPLDDPGLDIEARREIETVTVGLNVRGTLQEPRLTFFSDPSMPQTQIVSYLLTGKGSNTSFGGDSASTSASRETLAIQGGGGLLASQLGRRLGIEEVGVESTVDSAGEANTSLVLGKFLSPRLFISYGISLTESINTLKLRYTLSDKWIFKTEAGENQSADLEYTIER